MALSTILTILLEMLYDFVGGTPGQTSYIIASAANYVFFAVKIIAHCAVILFLDYRINMNEQRVKKLLSIAIAINAINIIALILNIPFQYMFQITNENLYVRGNFFIVHAIIAYVPLIVILCDVLLSRKSMDRRKLWLTLVLMVPVPIGTTFDMFFSESRLTWPVFGLSLLFAYVFLIRSDNRIDSLTGIANRRSADEYILAMSKSLRKRVYSMIVIDMDDFKQINDTYGHAVGDVALVDAASILKMSTRHTDFVARTGGDEFLIVVPDVENAEGVAARIRKNLDEFNEKNRPQVPISMSMGYASYWTDGEISIEACLSILDSMMYRDKNDRRKRVLDEV